MFFQLLDDVSFERFGRLNFFSQEQGLFVDEFSFLLVGLERDGVELEEREVVGCGKGAHPTEVVEPEDGRRGRAEAVFHLGEQLVDLGEGGGSAEAVVELHAQRELVDVVFRKTGVVRKLHLGFIEGDRALFLEGVDGPFEELAVEVEADRRDLPRLLDAEDVARAPDLKVAHGDFHAAAVAARFDEGVQSLA